MSFFFSTRRGDFFTLIGDFFTLMGDFLIVIDLFTLVGDIIILLDGDLTILLEGDLGSRCGRNETISFMIFKDRKNIFTNESPKIPRWSKDNYEME